MPAGPLSQTLLALHAAALAAPPLGCRRALLMALRPHIPFESAVWGTGCETPPRVFSVDAVDFASDQLAAYAPWQQADRLRQAAAAAPGTAFRNEDLGPIADHWASDIHRHYCARFGISRSLAIAHLDRTLGVGELVMLFRADPEAPFSDAERTLLEEALPHLVLAARQRLLGDFPRLAAGEADGRALVDEAGRAFVCDPGFCARMQALFPDWSGPLLPAPLLPLVARGGRLRLADHAFVVERRQRGRLLSIHARAQTPLTPAERRAAEAFAAGLSARDVAASLGLSHRTVRNQLASAYAKLGVGSKVELVRRLAAQDGRGPQGPGEGAASASSSQRSVSGSGAGSGWATGGAGGASSSESP